MRINYTLDPFIFISEGFEKDNIHAIENCFGEIQEAWIKLNKKVVNLTIDFWPIEKQSVTQGAADELLIFCENYDAQGVTVSIKNAPEDIKRYFIEKNAEKFLIAK
jgi:hypothetical protein